MLSLISQSHVASFCAVFIWKSAVREAGRLSVTKQVRMDSYFFIPVCDYPHML